MPGPLRAIASEMNEAIVKPVKDEVGKALEVGIQSVTGGSLKLDPAAEAKKRAEETKRRSWAMRVLQWNKQLDDNARQVRQEHQQQELQRQQQVQKEEQIKQYKLSEKKQLQNQQVREAQTRAEVRKGIGG